MGRDELDESDVEVSPIPLPSSFDARPAGWVRVSNLEEELRVAQAEEALEALRVDISHKSFLYLENRDWATGKRERTRGYDRINAVEANMRLHIKKYECARWALGRLGVGGKYPQFLPLTRADTKAVTAVFNPNKRGERNAGMSWIWRGRGEAEVDGEMDVERIDKGSLGTSSEDDAAPSGKEPRNAYLDESTFHLFFRLAHADYGRFQVYRVRWLRAKCRVDRWREEVAYLTSEMSWYVNFMGFQERACHVRAGLDEKMGNYAAPHELRQADIWCRRAFEAQVKFGWVSAKEPAKQETPVDSVVNSDDEVNDFDAE